MNVREREAAYVIGSLLELIDDLQPDPEYFDYYGLPGKLEQARLCVAMLHSEPTFSGDQDD